MSFLVGKTQQTSNVNPQTEGLHKSLLSFLGGGQNGGLDRLFPASKVSSEDMLPYLAMFQQQNARNFGQAKESAGNLTGSGLSSLIGQEAGRANVEQGAFLANLFENRRRSDADRFAQILLGSLGSPAGGINTYYQPGFLDYATQGLGGLAQGGAFNFLFNRPSPGSKAG